MRIAALIAIAALLGGCQTPCPMTHTAPVEVTYDCEDGSSINVTYALDLKRATVVQEGYSSIELASRVSGTGFRFGGAGAELQGRLSQVHWARAGASETMCRERAPSGAAAGAPSAQRETAIRACGY